MHFYTEKYRQIPTFQNYFDKIYRKKASRANIQNGWYTSERLEYAGSVYGQRKKIKQIQLPKCKLTFEVGELKRSFSNIRQRNHAKEKSRRETRYDRSLKS